MTFKEKSPIQLSSLKKRPFRVIEFEKVKEEETKTKFKPINWKITEKTVESEPISSNKDVKKSIREKIFETCTWSVSPTAIGPGLLNAGNTCFLNSVLQCLMYTPPLAAYFLTSDQTRHCSSNYFCSICEFSRLVNRCIGNDRKQGDKKNPVVPKVFLRQMKTILKTFKPGKQGDSHEFMSHLLDSLEDCYTKYHDKHKNNLENLDKGSLKITNVINQMFSGSFISSLICSECDRKSDTLEPFFDVSLEISDSSSVSKAFYKFTRSEKLYGKNQYNCENCKKLVDATKTFTIKEVPPVLCVHLKRFNIYGAKINKFIDFENRIDLSPFVAAEGKISPLWYSLYAVIVHVGSTTRSGHYYNYVKNSTGMWYSMDDDDVRQVKLNSVLRENAYMLFYVAENNCATSNIDFGIDKLFKKTKTTSACGSSKKTKQ
jgi:ubiquitin C-terminal hydrolase